MFIQLKDLDQTVSNKESNVFIIHTLENNPLYMSRSFADHDITKYTSNDKERAIVYFNKQAAVEALSTAFCYTGLSLEIERIPINDDVKEDAKRSDAIKRMMKNQARKKKEKKPWN